MREWINLIERVCQTPGAVYNTEITSNSVAVEVDLPKEVPIPDMTNDEAQKVEDSIHDAMEKIVAKMIADLDDDAKDHWDKARKNDPIKENQYSKTIDAEELISRFPTSTVTLYHGTCPDSAKALCANGWQPNSGNVGGNMGQKRYLYLSTHPEDAEWFANEKGCSTVVRVSDVPLDALIVDPEDGTGDDLASELTLPHGLPGKVALVRALDASHFKIVRSEDRS